MRGVHRQDDEEEGLVPPAVVVKGKRSKRQRVHAPPVAEWSSSAAASATPGVEGNSASGTSADDAASTGGCGVTEEEEDMVLCLMLLSRSQPAAKGVSNIDGGEVVVVKDARSRSRRPAAGEFVYECKTCSRCFPSFQALGGHRTSHKQKTRLLPPSDDKSNPATAGAPPLPPPSSAPKEATSDATALAIPVPAAAVAVPKQEPGTVSPTTSSRHPSRVHECSVCGAGFASGQALGGHMRRHRPLAPRRKEKNLLELDLNIPCDEAVTSPRFIGFAQPAAAAMLFPAALVDCHY
jgi:hypothetical protein